VGPALANGGRAISAPLHANLHAIDVCGHFQCSAAPAGVLAGTHKPLCFCRCPARSQHNPFRSNTLSRHKQTLSMQGAPLQPSLPLVCSSDGGRSCLRAANPPARLSNTTDAVSQTDGTCGGGVRCSQAVPPQRRRRQRAQQLAACICHALPPTVAFLVPCFPPGPGTFTQDCMPHLPPTPSTLFCVPRGVPALALVTGTVLRSFDVPAASLNHP